MSRVSNARLAQVSLSLSLEGRGRGLSLARELALGFSFVVSPGQAAAQRRPVEAAARRLGIPQRNVVVCSAAFEQRLATLAERPGAVTMTECGDASRDAFTGQSATSAYLAANPSHRSVAPELLWAPFAALNCLTVYTCSNESVDAWLVRDGATLRDLARGVHELLARHLTLAEVADVADLRHLGAPAPAKRPSRSL